MNSPEIPKIRSMSERKYELVPVDRINILNPRSRDKRQFDESVRSIDDVGLYKPICVNCRNFKKTGMYDLVCGQGRLEAYIALSKEEILAEIIDEDDTNAYIFSLVENIARVRPSSIEFARTLVQMYDSGVTIPDLVRITGRSDGNIKEYIRLMKNGEERLIRGVEENIYPISFATQVASSDETSAQQLLMDAYEDGMINSSNLRDVRDIIDGRMQEGRTKPPRNLEELKTDIKNITEQKEGFCEQAQRRESRLIQLLIVIKKLMADPKFRECLKENGFMSRLELTGTYVY